MAWWAGEAATARVGSVIVAAAATAAAAATVATAATAATAATGSMAGWQAALASGVALIGAMALAAYSKVLWVGPTAAGSVGAGASVA